MLKNFYPQRAAISFFISTAICFGVLSSTVAADRAEENDRKWLTMTVKVTDADGQPLEDVAITPHAARTIPKAGHFFWRERVLGKLDTVITNAEGLAELPYPEFIEEKLRTVEVSCLIDHPNYPRTAKDLTIGKQASFSLESPGAVVKVLGYRDSPDEPLVEYHVLAVPDANGWVPRTWRKVGPWRFTRRIRPGKAQLRLVHLPKDGPALFSDILEFEASENGNHAYKLQLKPGTRVNGRLDDSVPRPVKNGRVLCRVSRESELRDQIYWHAWREIAADGSFVFESLPRGETVQVIVICDGSVSASGHDPNAHLRDLYFPQKFSLVEPTVEVTIKMEPTATCEVQVLDESEQPVPGALVKFAPNRTWYGGGSGIFAMQSDYSDTAALLNAPRIGTTIHELRQAFKKYGFHSTTNAQGIATVVNIPGRHRKPFEESFSVTHEDFELPIRTRNGEAGERIGTVDLHPGKKSKITVTVQKKGTETLGEKAQ